jgi:carbohydrate-binding DOMON domain-containing protein
MRVCVQCVYKYGYMCLLSFSSLSLYFSQTLIHAHIHTRKHTHTHTNTYPLTHTHTHTHTYTHTHTHTDTHAQEANKLTPCLVCHGDSDQVVNPKVFVSVCVCVCDDGDNDDDSDVI